MNLRRWLMFASVLSIFVLVFLLDAHYRFHSQLFATLISSLAFFRTRTWSACGAYVAMYVAASLLGVPLTPFEIFTGFCFGVGFGIILDVTGRVLGAVISFCIARLLSWSGAASCPCVSGEAVLRGVGKAVQEDGLKFLILLNMAYVPVAVKNYGLGFIPEVSLFKFVASIFIVEVPMACIWASFGNAAANNLEEAGISLSNATAVHDAVSIAHQSLGVKAGLFLCGFGAIFIVLHVIHKKVATELARIKASTEKDIV